MGGAGPGGDNCTSLFLSDSGSGSVKCRVLLVNGVQCVMIILSPYLSWGFAVFMLRFGLVDINSGNKRGLEPDKRFYMCI